jgi:hypothetical protein
MILPRKVADKLNTESKRMKNQSVAGVPGHDPTLPDVKLEVDGEVYQLSYDFNAIVRAEQATGINLLNNVLGDIGAASLRGLLWAALLKDHPELTLEQAGSLIRPSNIGEVRKAIVIAWFGSIKDQDDTTGEAQETPQE